MAAACATPGLLRWAGLRARERNMVTGADGRLIADVTTQHAPAK